MKNNRSEMTIDKDQVCFKCNKLINEDYILWQGDTAIILHPDCATDLAIELIIDDKSPKVGNRTTNINVLRTKLKNTINDVTSKHLNPKTNSELFASLY